MEILASRIDRAAEDSNVDELKTLIEKCDEYLKSTVGHDRVFYLFYKANCHAAMSIMRINEDGYTWSWSQQEKIAETLNLRKAILEKCFSDTAPIIQCKILTNLGSTLSHLGRIIEAIKCWDAALEIMPNFAMALGNKGQGLLHYLGSHYDDGHKVVIAAFAKEDLNNAITDGALWDSGLDVGACEAFTRDRDRTVANLNYVGYDAGYDLDQWPLGDNEDEIAYRKWCLKNRFFLSSLNDVCTLSVAAQDVLHLPSHTYKVDETPRFPNYFNILKQEYGSARYMLYKAIHRGSYHISDKDILLLDGFDGVSFGYRTEQLKTAYRLSYSLFDKIAVFLYDYFSIPGNIRSVSFRNIWWKKSGKNKTLHDCFSQSENWPLRGLYYLSKDLFDEEFRDVSLPEAKELADLRNSLEHRFLSVQDYAVEVTNTDAHSYMTHESLVEKTMKILSMAREAMVYLSLAMHREESIRSVAQEKEGLTMPILSVPIKRF